MTDRRSLPNLTKYERAALLAERARALASGSPSTLSDPGTSNPVEIAYLEFKAGRLPIKIVRQYPNGDTETWSVRELQ